MGGFARLADPVIGAVLVGRYLQDGVGALVERVEVLAADGPAAVLHPRTVVKGDLVPRTAEAAPAVAAAAQETAAGTVGEIVRATDAGGTATFEHDRIDAGLFELEAHGDPGNAAANDTNLGLDDRAGSYLIGIDQHGWFPSRDAVAPRRRPLWRKRKAPAAHLVQAGRSPSISWISWVQYKPHVPVTRCPFCFKV